jgi:Glycosyl transferases group 1
MAVDRRREIWVGGYPSNYGGADTELDHQIDLWLSQGVEVHLVPNGQPDSAMRADLNARGAVTHMYRPGIFTGKVVVSYCNGSFLERLADICAAGRPRCMIWVNCMTWTFEKEIECHRLGLIDLFAFQSAYQRRWLLPELNAVRPVQELEGYRPYFNLARWPDQSRATKSPEQLGHYAIGRVSRDDASKYPADLWRIFGRISSPYPVKCFVLGWGPNALQKCGPPEATPGLDWMWWAPAAIQAPEFFGRLHTLVHHTGGSRENWPRVAFEAWASRVALLVECDYAWPEIVDDGETGFLCRSADEFVYRASELAHDEAKRERIVRSALQQLEAEHCDAQKSFAAWNRVL